MTSRLRQFATRCLGRDLRVSLADCVHFGGWRYGRGEFNPYENYAVGLARGEPVAALRERFIEFLAHYRPRDLGQALGTDLERRYSLWHFPWAVRQPVSAWVDDPSSCPDILTHFADAGILQSRIEEEFGWLEQTFDSIRTDGYRTGRNEFIDVRCLAAADGSRRYVVQDGNHRLSALAALGESTVVVRYLPAATVQEARLPRWRGVAKGVFTPDDARKVFRAYFDGNRRPRVVDSPAPILAHAGNMRT